MQVLTFASPIPVRPRCSWSPRSTSSPTCVPFWVCSVDLTTQATPGFVPRACLEQRRTGVASGVQRSTHRSVETIADLHKRWSGGQATEAAQQIPKLRTRVRFPSSALITLRCCSAGRMKRHSNVAGRHRRHNDLFGVRDNFFIGCKRLSQ